MAVEIKITAVCDKCGQRKPVDGIDGNCIRLPQGWIHNTSMGVLCDTCKKTEEKH